MLCNEPSIAANEHIGHLTFQCVIDCWDVRLDAGMPGAILSCSVVACSNHNHEPQ